MRYVIIVADALKNVALVNENVDNGVIGDSDSTPNLYLKTLILPVLMHTLHLVIFSTLALDILMVLFKFSVALVR